MFYTVQELWAQIKGWEYMIAILFLCLFIGFWVALGRQSKRQRKTQPARIATGYPKQGYLKEAGNESRPGHGTTFAPCWEARACPPEKRESCAGYALSPLPCWVARPMVYGKRWEPCASCSIYTQGMERLIQAYSKGPSTSAPADAQPAA